MAATTPPGRPSGAALAAGSADGGDTAELEVLLAVLPAWVQEAAEGDLGDVEELALDLGRPLAVRRAGRHVRTDRTVSKDDLHYVVHRLGQSFREDNRSGIDRTVHRIAALRDRYGAIVGLTLRVGRCRAGVAAPLTGVLHGGRDSLMVIGAPGVGKTTLLRDIARLLAERLGPQVVIVDTSNEIGGDGQVPHPAIGSARRLQVPHPSRQAGVLLEAVANHGPRVLVVDEVGYHADAEVIVSMARRGVRVIATVHGETLRDVLENPDLRPLLGGIDPRAGRRLGRPAFGRALEVRARGHFALHADVAGAVDRLLAGQTVVAQAVPVSCAGTAHGGGGCG